MNLPTKKKEDFCFFRKRSYKYTEVTFGILTQLCKFNTSIPGQKFAKKITALSFICLQPLLLNLFILLQPLARASTPFSVTKLHQEIFNSVKA